MKAIVVRDQAAGVGGMNLEARPEPQAAINDVVVEVHASGFVPTELTWPSTWESFRRRISKSNSSACARLPPAFHWWAKSASACTPESWRRVS